MQITNEYLVRIGGWRAAKEGRALFEAGRVLSVAYEPPLLSGVVREGESSVQARIRLAERELDVENLCSCREARRDGTICPHVLALGYAWLNQERAPAKTGPSDLVAPDAGKVVGASGQARVSDGAARSARIFERAEPEDASPDAPWIELAVVLPKQLAAPDGADRSSPFVQVYVEASLSGGDFVPLDQVFKRSHVDSFVVSEEDARLAAFLESEGIERTGGSLFRVPRKALDGFFDCCIGHPRISLGRELRLTICPVEHIPVVRFEMQESPWQVKVSFETPTRPAGVALGAWLLDGTRVRKHAVLPHAIAVALGDSLTLDRDAFGAFLRAEAPVLASVARIEPPDFLEKFRIRFAEPTVRAEFDGSENGLHVRVWAIYPGGVKFAIMGSAGTTDEMARPDPADTFGFWRRDGAAENAVRRELADCGFSPGRRDESLYVNNERGAAGQFFASHLPRLRARWEVHLSERLTRLGAKTVVVRPHVEFRPSHGGWLEGDLSFQGVGAPRLSPGDVRRMLETKRTVQRLNDGRMLVLPEALTTELVEALGDLDIEQSVDGSFRIRQSQAGYLANSVRASGGEALEERWMAGGLRDAPPINVQASLKKMLRPYQTAGCAWLARLAANGLGGILADEMGLGKTVQTLAFLSAWRSHQKEAKPAIVICPTSLVENWIEECAKFTPEIATLAYRGPKREELIGKMEAAGLVVTSYAILRLDVALLSQVEFGVAVLDEAQHVKNRESQNARAAKALKADQRFVLTGTPIENALSDLWSIFDFLMPGFLGRHDDFRERYEKPIAGGGDERALTRLRRRIGPFVLRRTKRDVAPELPPRLDETAWCGMSAEQQEVYAALLDEARRGVFEHAGAKGSAAKRRQIVFTALLRLRQASCHLGLLPGGAERKWKEPSAKLEACLERIHEAVDGQHRVLVFSQFVSFLGFVRNELEQREIVYCYLDGATRDRAGEIAKFRKGYTSVFLISLKAGGTGLNLTEADTVMLLDPWWNPAVESQALARAHRIGQERPVITYRFITRGSVEEKIQKLQQSKAGLASGALAGSGAAAAPTVEEMEALLRE